MRHLKRYTWFAVILFTSTMNGGAQGFKPPFQNSENTLPATSNTISYPNLNSALENSAENPRIIDLSGAWSIKFFDKQADADKHTLDNPNSWEDSVKLPSVWAMSNYTPAVYSDTAYPFLRHKPQTGRFPMPANYKTALYIKQTTIPFDFMDKKIYLTVGGGSSKITLFVNGKKVGFSTDSRVAAQYDITDFVQRGINTIALKVEQYSGASWVEDQCGWRTSGINRNIYIYAQPKIRIRDMINRTTLNTDRTTGLLSSALLLKTELLNHHTVTVYYELRDTNGKIIRKEEKNVTLGMRNEDTVRFNSTIRDVELWNPEIPKLYTIIYSVKREGRFTEFATKKIGFREIEIKKQKLLLNGVAPKFKGINLAEFDPHTIAVLDKQKVLIELQAMKKLGVNAIRTDGYPLPPFFYDMTDSIGFMVVNVANLSTAGLENNINKGKSLANDPNWKNIYTDRIISAYELTKNHTSVIGLALGQLAGNGYNMYQARLELRRRNPKLVVFYDNHSGWEWNTDVVTPMYPTIEDIEKINHQIYSQPIIPAKVKVDYRYWTNKKTQGAFIDRWLSGSITNSYIREFVHIDNNYSQETTPSGTLPQYGAVDQKKFIAELFSNLYVEITDHQRGVISITNQMDYKNLENTVGRYRIIKNGRAGMWKTFTVNCNVGDTQNITLMPLGVGNKIEVMVGDVYTRVIE